MLSNTGAGSRKREAGSGHVSRSLLPAPCFPLPAGERGAPPNVELHRAPCLAGTVGAVFGLLPGLFVGAHPAGGRHPYAARPGSRPNARKSRKGAAGVGSGPPFPGAVPHLDDGSATG